MDTLVGGVPFLQGVTPYDNAYYLWQKALQYALSGGDDYHLAYTAPHCDFGIHIGDVVQGSSVNVLGVDLIAGGYQHF